MARCAAWGMVVAMKPPTPHDAIFRETFADVAHAAGLLRHLVRRSIASRIQWSTLSLCPGSFVDRSLRSRHSDLLFKVRCGDREVYLYLLLEHQSTSDPLMPFRLLVYMVRVWERHVREHPGVTCLPAILPMVVHHSREGWTSPTSFSELFDLDPAALAAFSPFLPSFRFILDDLRVASDASLRARAMSALGRLTLFCLRHASEPDEIVRRMARWLLLLREIRGTPGGSDALELIWRYIFTVSAPPVPEDLVERLVLVVGEESKEEIVTAAEHLMERGRKEARRDMLLELLNARFGALPEAIAGRVRGADRAQLKRWAIRVLTAASLSDVLSEA